MGLFVLYNNLRLHRAEMLILLYRTERLRLVQGPRAFFPDLMRMSFHYLMGLLPHGMRVQTSCTQTVGGYYTVRVGSMVLRKLHFIGEDGEWIETEHSSQDIPILQIIAYPQTPLMSS